jgi:hypothetical protein
MSSHEPSAPEPGGRILSFRRPNGAVAPQRPKKDQDRDAVEDLSKYARDETPDDYRHRMIVNIVAFAFVAVLGLIGYWLADTMATMRKNQDCVLTGRRGCTPVDIPQRERY